MLISFCHLVLSQILWEGGEGGMGGGGVGVSGCRAVGCQAETSNRVYFGLYYSKKRTGFNTNVTNSSNQISQSLRRLPVFLRSRHKDDRNCLLTSHAVISHYETRKIVSKRYK